MKRVILHIIAVVTALTAPAMTTEDIRRSVRAEYLSEVADTSAAAHARSIDADGKWADIDYADDSRSLWQLEKHLDRLVDISLVYEQGGSADTTLYNAVMLGLDQWFGGRYENPNWWYTKIGVPRRMLALAYILDSDLQPRHREALDSALNVIDGNDFPARPGGDRIQVLSNHAKVMLWRRNAEGLKEILDKIETEARIAPMEETMYDAGGSLAARNNWRPSGRGVQRDMSFHHRGDRVDATLTYGLHVPEHFAYWAQLLKDSDMAFSPEAIRFIIDYYLDGVTRHLVAGRFAEPTIMNRELSRPGSYRMNSDIAHRLLAITDGYRAGELRQSIDAIESGRNVNKAYAADFGESAYFVFSRPEFQVGVRYHSERNSNQEAPHNSEGIRNHFRGDGACMTSMSGMEYADIAPVFDFRMIPGATTPLIPYEPLEGWGDVQVLNPPTKHARAISDSVHGAVAFDFISPRTDLKARKGYFFFDQGFVCLGSGISANSSHPIVTTVEQCFSPDATFEKDARKYLHGGLVYEIITGEAEAAVDHRKGSWANCASNTEYADIQSEADVFTLAISHGVNPENENYAYAVYPAQSNIESRDFFNIICNDATCQAVISADKKLMYVIFYERGEVDTPLGVFNASEPRIIMVKEGKTNSIEL